VFRFVYSHLNYQLTARIVRATEAAVPRSICLITGATAGVGRATALELIRRGFHVVAAVRNEDKAQALKTEAAALGMPGDIDYIIADLSSLAQVRRLAQIFRARYPRLEVLINNAGIFPSRRTTTVDDCETAFQVNYLSHFLLTRSLLPELQRSERARVVNVSSSVYTLGRFDPANLQSERRFSALRTYASSKLFVTMFTEELARRLTSTSVTVNAVHPGIVRTQMMLGTTGVFRALSYLSLPFASSPQEGADVCVHVATAPELTGISGRYFDRRRVSKIKNEFDTRANRALLWDLSTRLVEGTSTVSPRRTA